MEKKYQVFISSTYKDLIEERKQVLSTVLMADCIPAGMEAFVATDDEQFNVIKKVIDLCDYYILIIGRKYGSINQKTNLSYTEMEYNYALSKDIPVLVFALDDTNGVQDDGESEDITKQAKLIEFKSRAMTNRIASIWQNKGDLNGKVAISIMRAKQEISRPGWQRGGELDQTELLSEILDLRRENEELKTELIEIHERISAKKENANIAFYGHKVVLHFTERLYVVLSDTIIGHINKEITLDELFKIISMKIVGKIKVSKFIEHISNIVPGYDVDEDQALQLKVQYSLLELIESIEVRGQELISLTEKGKKYRDEMNMIKALEINED